MYDYKYEEIKSLRERVKNHENRRFQMILICATGYSAVLGVSEKISSNIIPLILFALIAVTENIHYNEIKNSYFITQLIIYISKNLGIPFNLEDIYINVYSKIEKVNDKVSIFKKCFIKIKNSLLIRIVFYPFFIMPLLYVITSLYFIIPILKIKKMSSIEWILSIIILGMYLMIFLRNIKLLTKTVKKYFSEKFFQDIKNYYK